ncbi:MAG TPA: AraC family transcriptional regulator [Chitinophagaceae bacterium]|nr:AraC family transcriptional regulator [Chitinophagaceae bacterium]
MRLYIKNMVCSRCIMVVKQLLDAQGLAYTSVQLGEVELKEALTPAQQDQLKKGLSGLGFELLDDSKKQVLEKIKTFIIRHVHYNSSDPRYNVSQLLSEELGKDYSYLSHLFSDVEGTTIEKYLINQKIEKVKELLVYNEASLSDIAFQLGYSSVAHLSAQFKKVTGLTPTHFKKLGGLHRKTLDAI